MNVMQQVVSTIHSPEFRQQVAAVLPANISFDRFSQTTVVALQNNADLLNADRQSLYNGISRAASDGLMPDGKEGALVIFNKKIGNNFVKSVQWMPMVEGIIKQMGKAGIKAYAASVYANDEIEVWNDDDGQHIKHKPVVFGDRGDMVGVFACAKVGEQTYVETLNLGEIDKIRSASRSGNGGPWAAWPDRMAQKSALHRLKKRLPILDSSIVDSLRDPEEDADIVPMEEPVAEAAPVEKKRPRGLQAVVEQATVEVAPSADDEDIF